MRSTICAVSKNIQRRPLTSTSVRCEPRLRRFSVAVPLPGLFENEVVPGTDEFLAAAGLKKKTVLNADGEYFDEAKEAGSWQDAWAQRAAKASKMSGDDILNAARGAGNVDASQPESAKARKRRAVAACRTDAVRERMAAGTAAECLERALAGETDFVLGKS